MIAILLGIVVGLILGLTGAGGSIFAVPLLIFGLGWTMSEATPVALLAVGGSALLGTLLAWKTRQVCQRAALILGIAGSLSAPVGVRIAQHAPASTLLLAFAVVMLIAAARMLWQTRARPWETPAMRARPEYGAKAEAVCRVDLISRRIRVTAPCALALAGSGIATGILSGALGVGAGFVIVPTLRAATGLSMAASIATSLMAITIISAAAAAGHFAAGASFPFSIAAPFLLGALAGMLVGRWAVPRMPAVRLQQTFALLLIAAAASMAWRGLR